MVSMRSFFNGLRAHGGEMVALRVFFRTVVGFVLPVLIWYGTVVILGDTRYGFRHVIDPESHGRLGPLPFFAWPIAPFVGYFSIATAFGPWRELERRALVSIIAVSAVYWTVYGMMLLFWLVIFALSFAPADF